MQLDNLTLSDQIKSSATSAQSFSCLPPGAAAADAQVYTALKFDGKADIHSMYIQSMVHQYSMNTTVMTSQWALSQGKT